MQPHRLKEGKSHTFATANILFQLTDDTSSTPAITHRSMPRSDLAARTEASRMMCECRQNTSGTAADTMRNPA